MSAVQEKKHLDLGARLAMRGAGRVEPNPLVGAVLVRDGRVIGVGHHERFGGLHAEANALADASRRGESARGATLLCTLEPCNAPGRQPPCTAALIDAGIARVVFARRDPTPGKGGGAEALARAGLAVELSDASPLATGISAPFIKRATTGLPWVIAKWAQTIDGRLATRSGESKWISNDLSRARVHRLRARVDAILTGIGTIAADDPALTARSVPIRRVAKRIVVDSDLEIPADRQIIRTAAQVPTIIACDRDLLTAAITAGKRDALEKAGVVLLGIPAAGVGRRIDLRALLAALLRDHGVSTVMVEAGPGLLGSLFAEDLIDEAVVYIAPMLLGDEMARAVAVGRVAQSLANAKKFSLWRAKRLGSDVELTYRGA